jgi:hypothetical protein
VLTLKISSLEELIDLEQAVLKVEAYMRLFKQLRAYELWLLSPDYAHDRPTYISELLIKTDGQDQLIAARREPRARPLQGYSPLRDVEH